MATLYPLHQKQKVCLFSFWHLHTYPYKPTRHFALQPINERKHTQTLKTTGLLEVCQLHVWKDLIIINKYVLR